MPKLYGSIVGNHFVPKKFENGIVRKSGTASRKMKKTISPSATSETLAIAAKAGRSHRSGGS